MLFVGTSGWSYKPWNGIFYPEGTTAAKQLRYASEQFSALEINSTFYGLKKPDDFQKWHDSVPEDFVFAVKASRYMTHYKKLSHDHTPIANFFASGLLALGPKLGPILWQLSPSEIYDPKDLAAFFALLPKTGHEAQALAERHGDKVNGRSLTECSPDLIIRHAVECRHPAQLSDAVIKLARESGIVLVFPDSNAIYPVCTESTGDFVYYRMHGLGPQQSEGYSLEDLKKLQEETNEWQDRGKDVYVFFDNEAKLTAPGNAVEFLQMAKPGSMLASW